MARHRTDAILIGIGRGETGDLIQEIVARRLADDPDPLSRYGIFATQDPEIWTCLGCDAALEMALLSQTLYPTIPQFAVDRYVAVGVETVIEAEEEGLWMTGTYSDEEAYHVMDGGIATLVSTATEIVSVNGTEKGKGNGILRDVTGLNAATRIDAQKEMRGIEFRNVSSVWNVP